MEHETMGRVLTEATVENLADIYDVDRGQRSADQVRRITVSDALVDSGATGLALPKRYIEQLGLVKKSEKRIRSAKGASTVDIFSGVRLTIQGRDMVLDAMEVPDEVPVLIGQIPLEYLDFVVDPQGCRLIGNPAHGGEQVLELY